jgi:hypothetical protein
MHTQPMRPRFDFDEFDKKIERTLADYDESERHRVDHILAEGGIAILGASEELPASIEIYPPTTSP